MQAGGSGGSGGGGGAGGTAGAGPGGAPGGAGGAGGAGMSPCDWTSIHPSQKSWCRGYKEWVIKVGMPDTKSEISTLRSMRQQASITGKHFSYCKPSASD